MNQTHSSRSLTKMTNFLSILMSLRRHFLFSLNVSDQQLVINFVTSELANTETKQLAHIITSLCSAIPHAKEANLVTQKYTLPAVLSAILLESIGASDTSCLVALNQHQRDMLLDMCRKSTVKYPQMTEILNSLACPSVPVSGSA